MSNLTALQNAVLTQLGYDELTQEAREVLADVAAYGADAGFSGFIYYNETRDFALANMPAIRERLKQDADNIGVGLLDMVQGFRCLNDDYSVDDIAEVIYGGSTDSDESTQILNALSWYALEVVAYDLTND